MQEVKSSEGYAAYEKKSSDLCANDHFFMDLTIDPNIISLKEMSQHKHKAAFLGKSSKILPFGFFIFT